MLRTEVVALNPAEWLTQGPGALNALVSGPRPDRLGGNHGLGVATVTALTKWPATVYAPETVIGCESARMG